MDGGEGTERCSSISTHALNVNYDSSTQSLSDWDGGTGSSHRFDPSGQSGDMDVTSDVAFLDRSNPPFCGNDALTIGSQGMPCTAQPQASNEGSPWLNVPNAKLLFHMAGPAALGTKAPAELLLKKAIPNGGSEGSTKSKLPRPLSGAFSATQSVQQPGMSWQCFSSLLFTGPGSKHMAEGTAGVQSMVR